MRTLGIITAFIFAAVAAAPQLALAGKTNSFYGEVVHVSVDNIKVFDPKNKQTLGFVLDPHFDQVFSSDGKTTYQMKKLQHGQYVRVVYDQKALGIRHADKIFIMTNGNQPVGKP